MDVEVNVVATRKGDENYIITYRDDQKSEALRQLGYWAVDPELSFTWYDAAVMSKSIRGSQDPIFPDFDPQSLSRKG